MLQLSLTLLRLSSVKVSGLKARFLNLAKNKQSYMRFILYIYVKCPLLTFSLFTLMDKGTQR